jgi:hypothetical protein
MFHLDANGSLLKVKVNNWRDGLGAHWGRFGSWVMFNVDPMDNRVAVESEEMYQGDGSDYRWHIRWD